MDYIYHIVRKIKNPTLRRISYHLLQLVSGFGMGIFCGVVTGYFSKQTPLFELKPMLIMGASLGVGMVILSLTWYNKAKDFYND